MSESNTKPFRSLNTYSIDIVKSQISKCPSKICSLCGYHHKYGQCSAKDAKCKICHKICHYVRVFRSKSKYRKPNKYISNNQPARFIGTKMKTKNVHLVTNES